MEKIDLAKLWDLTPAQQKAIAELSQEQVKLLLSRPSRKDSKAYQRYYRLCKKLGISTAPKGVSQDRAEYWRQYYEKTRGKDTKRSKLEVAEARIKELESIIRKAKRRCCDDCGEMIRDLEG